MAANNKNAMTDFFFFCVRWTTKVIKTDLIFLNFKQKLFLISAS